MLVAEPQLLLLNAQRDWNSFVQQAGTGLDQVIGPTNDLNKELSKTEKAIQEAADALKKLNIRDVIEKSIGAMGGFKDILEKTGTAVFGLEQKTTDAAVASLDLGEKGAQLLGVFGPLGAVVGAAGGALLGYIGYANNAAKAEEELTAKIEAQIKARQAQINQEARALKRATRQDINELGDILSEMADIEDKIADKGQKLTQKQRDALTNEFTVTEEAVKKAQKNIISARKQVLEEEAKAIFGTSEALTKAKLQLEDATIAANDLATRAGEDFDRINEKLDDYTKARGKATKAVKEQTDAEKDNLDAMLAANDALKERRELERQEEDRTVGDSDRGLGHSPQSERAAQEQQIRIDQENLEEESYQRRVATYRSYVNHVTSITSELSATLEQNVAAGESLFEGFGRAAEKGISNVLKALSKEYTAKALGEAAEAIATFGTPAFPKHASAAVAYGVAATATGFGGAVLAGDAQRRAAQASSSAPETAPASGLGGSSEGTRDLRPIVVNFSSTVPHTEREQQEAAERINGLLRKRRPH